MGAHANVADHAGFPQFPGVGQNRSFKDGAEVLLAVHIVNHPYINVVGVQALQQIFEGAFCFFYIPGTGILPVLKYGAQMAWMINCSRRPSRANPRLLRVRA